MSDIYIEIDKMFSDKTEANPDLESKMPGVMSAAAEETAKKMKNKGITTKKPTDKKAKGYYLGGRLSSLKIENGVLKCEVNLVLSTWPGRSIVASSSRAGQKRLPSEPTDEQIAKLAEELVAETTAEITEKTLTMAVKEQP
jgi:hypothetical protein